MGLKVGYLKYQHTLNKKMGLKVGYLKVSAHPKF